MSTFEKKQNRAFIKLGHIVIWAFIIGAFVTLMMVNGVKNFSFWDTHLSNLIDEAFLLMVVYYLLKATYLNKDEQIKEELGELISTNRQVIESIQKEGFPVEKFFHSNYIVLKSDIEKAEAVFLCGITLREVLENYRDIFSSLIGQKKKIKIMIAEPSDHILEIWSRNHVLKGNFSTLKSYFRDSINILNALSGLNKDLFEIRTLPFIPTHGMFILEQKNKKLMWVQIFSQPFEDNKSKFFKVLADRDENEYKYYYDQFSMIWNQAKLYSIHETKKFLDAEINPGQQEFHIDFSKKVTELSQHWYSWKKYIKTNDSIKNVVFEKFINEYISTQAILIKQKRIKTTSDIYVRLVKDITNYLYNNQRGRDETIYRFQLTGMLPEEFYNGPQIEYTKLNSKPVFFCHKWENYKEFYGPDVHKEKLFIQRCLIIKDNSITLPQYSALHSLSDFEEQKGLLVIGSDYIRINDLESPEYAGVAERLLKHFNTNQANVSSSHTELIRKIINSEDYRYFPIIKRAKDTSADSEKGNNLLSYYAKQFHNHPEDAFYMVINNSNLSEFQRQNSILKIFKEGKVPEISLFARYNEKTKSFENFVFGLKGEYTLYTREMEIEVFSEEQLAHLSQLVKQILPNFSKSEQQALRIIDFIKS